MSEVALVNFSPALRLVALVLVLVLLPLAYVWQRTRRAEPASRARVGLAALTAVTLFLTFDLIVFGAFTRLTDSGLGCPDWPGCYGHASPVGAQANIRSAQDAMPSGPVTFGKAWIEMIHRYLAMTVGLLILITTALSWRLRRALPHSPWWPTLSLVWVLVQGLFGKYTVTLKLYPLVVTAHLLGGMLLLALLALQHQAFNPHPAAARHGLPARMRLALIALLGMLVLQIALGGWVSTNYAVLACADVPRCNGQWWPAMDFANGFTLMRELGQAANGQGLPFEALVAIHMVHRMFAVVLVLAIGSLGVYLLRRHDLFAPSLVRGLLALTVLQVLSGLSNIVLGWPLFAALAHSAGAAGMVWLLTLMLARAAVSSEVGVKGEAQVGASGPRLGAA